MKSLKLFKNLIGILFIFILSVGCTDSDPKQHDGDIRLDKDKSIYVDQTANLYLSLISPNVDKNAIVWVSKNPDIVSLSVNSDKSCTITGLETGKAVIRVSVEGTQLVQECLVTVLSPNDYFHIAFIGQSLTMGWESPEVITTTAIKNNFMYGNNTNVKYSTGDALQALVSNKWSQGGEQPIVAAVNAFSEHWRSEINKDQKFIASTSGEGGQSIERLSKDYANGIAVGANLYTTTFLKHIEKLKNTVSKDNNTIACPAIVFMQGEFNYPTENAGLGMTPGTDGTTNKDQYKALLLKLKNDMQNDIMKTYGQKEKPLFFIYQTSGYWISLKDMPINMAQVEFALENDDVVLLPPTYQTSDYNGGHLSTNGYRWYGEYIAKAFHSTLIKKEEYMPIFPTVFNISGKDLKIKFHVPNPPLAFDTWTTPTVANYGFKLFQDGAEISIPNIVVSGDEVTLTAANALTGTIEVSYAGEGTGATRGTSGTGNLRDSDFYESMYTYYDDSAASHKEAYTPKDKDGNLIYGKSYPLENWCIPFYKKVN